MKIKFPIMPIWLFVLDCAVVVWDVYVLVRGANRGEWLGFWILLLLVLLLIFQMLTFPFPQERDKE